MDSLSTQKTKPRKIKRLAKKSRAKIILDLFFRTIEIIVVLVTVAKLSYQLVLAFEDSGVAAVILANRSLAFLVGNMIVIALLAKSGLFLNQELDPECKSNDLYVEFIRERSRRDGISRSEMGNRGKQGEAENEAKKSILETRVKQSDTDTEEQRVIEKKMKLSVAEKREKQSRPKNMTKHIISVKREKQSIVEKQDITTKIEKQNLTEKKQTQCYQRSRSENLEGLEKSYCGRLRRSETDASSSERCDSDDELRYKIESFIERQRRNLNDV